MERIKVRIKSPLFECLSKMELGGYVDVECDGDFRAVGNLISAKISIWKKTGKLEGNYSRKVQREDDIIRVFRTA